MEVPPKVEITFLEQEIESLKKKLALHSAITTKNKELVQRLAEARTDAENEQLGSAAANKYQVLLQLATVLEESKAAQEQLDLNLEQFKVVSHLKSLADCSEIIFENRRLKASLNIYLSFKKDQEKLTQTYKQLNERINEKSNQFLKRLKSAKGHVKEQQILIIRDLRKQLTEGAFRICGENIETCVRRYMRANANKRGLENHINLALKQHRPSNKNKQGSSESLSNNKEVLVQITKMMKVIKNLRREISAVAEEIDLIKLQNRGELSEMIVFPTESVIPTADLTSMSLNPDERSIRNELCGRNNCNGELTSIQEQIADMIIAKNEIHKLSCMIVNFRKRPLQILETCTENRFQELELESFLNNVYDLARKSIVSKPRELGTALEVATAASQLTVESERTEPPRSEALSVLSSIGTSAVSSEVSLRAAPMVEVESDPEELYFIYEIQKVEEEEPEEEEEEFEPSYGDDEDSLMV